MTEETAKLVSLVESLPDDVKIELVDKILESLSPTQKEIDELWKIEVERRIEEMENGDIKTIPGDEVFAKIRQRFD